MSTKQEEIEYVTCEPCEGEGWIIDESVREGRDMRRECRDCGGDGKVRAPEGSEAPAHSASGEAVDEGASPWEAPEALAHNLLARDIYWRAQAALNEIEGRLDATTLVECKRDLSPIGGTFVSETLKLRLPDSTEITLWIWRKNDERSNERKDG